MDEQMKQILPICPSALQQSLEHFLSQRKLQINEIRLRAGMPAAVLSENREYPLYFGQKPLIASKELLEDLLSAAVRYSKYSYRDELANGFCTIEGGHRLGICGEAVTEQGRICGIKAVSSLNLRIAREFPGCARALMTEITENDLGLIIAGTPGSGKTTVLRDLVRLISDQREARVGLVDERGEIAACRNGVPQLNVGMRTDVLSGAGKKDGIYLLLRSMSPQWIAVDEISDQNDAEAMIHAAYSGIRLVVTAHAFGLEDLKKRTVYQRLLDSGFFSLTALIQRDRSITLERIHSHGS